MTTTTALKTCLRCGYQWQARSEHPRVCPRCCQQWDKPRKIAYQARQRKAE